MKTNLNVLISLNSRQPVLMRFLHQSSSVWSSLEFFPLIFVMANITKVPRYLLYYQIMNSTIHRWRLANWDLAICQLSFIVLINWGWGRP
jgi:hypothetical protein